MQLAGEIQGIFGTDRTHHRLLTAKLWAFEACLDANRTSFAESGFLGIKGLAKSGTRLCLEASSFLAICYLRQKRFQEAKDTIKYVISNINNIKSDTPRHEFQQQLIGRIEEECILADLIGRNEGALNVEDIHNRAIQLIRNNNEEEIIKLVGESIPASGILLLREVREYSVLQINIKDQKRLPSPKEVEKPLNLGKRAMAILKRIGWKVLCDSDSEIYKKWSKKDANVFSSTFFATSLVSQFKEWNIGIPVLVSAFVAVAMKYSAEYFCETTKPEGLMIKRGGKIT